MEYYEDFEDFDPVHSSIVHEEKDCDEALVQKYVDAAGKAFRLLFEAHPGEHFYTAEILFNKEWHPWVSVFSVEAYRRAMEEQEITDPDKLFWFKLGGRHSLSVAYDYYMKLTELYEVVDKDKRWYHAFSQKAKSRMHQTHLDAADEAIWRLNESGLFRLVNPAIRGSFWCDEKDPPIPRFTVTGNIGAALEESIDTGETVHLKIEPFGESDKKKKPRGKE